MEYILHRENYTALLFWYNATWNRIITPSNIVFKIIDGTLSDPHTKI